MTEALPPVARWALVGTAVVWAALELRQAVRHRPEGVTANWRSEIAFRSVVGAGVLGAVAVRRLVPAATIRPAVVAAWVGLALLWCGIALRFWSVRTLGRYFTLVVQTSTDQPVITDGPYRLVRHPSYAGMLLAFMGLGLLIGNWLSFVTLTVAMAFGLVLRIRVEEQALLRDIGDDYRTYAASHRRLVPFLW